MTLGDTAVGIVLLASAIFLTVRNPTRNVRLAALTGLRWGAYAVGACALFLLSEAARRGQLSQLDTRDFWDLVAICAIGSMVAFTAAYLILLWLGWRHQNRFDSAVAGNPETVHARWQHRYGLPFVASVGAAFLGMLILHLASGSASPMSDTLVFAGAGVAALLFAIGVRFYRPPEE